MELEQTLGQVADHRNIQRLSSLHNTRVALGSLALPEVAHLRERILGVYDNSIRDLFIIDDELQRRTPVDECAD